jgi:hypothetical protein
MGERKDLFDFLIEKKQFLCPEVMRALRAFHASTQFASSSNKLPKLRRSYTNGVKE